MGLVTGEEPGAEITGLEPVPAAMVVVGAAPVAPGAGWAGCAGLAEAKEEPAAAVVGDPVPVPTEVAPAEQPAVATAARVSTANQVRGAITFL